MKRLIAPGTDKCIFCGASPTTREHVYSAWTHKYITKHPGRWKGVVGEQSIDAPRDVIEIKGRGDIHDWQVKCVCEATCNNGWMRELENRACPLLTPLIKGRAAHLTPQDQRIIAGWACLKAIVGEYEHPHMTTWNKEARQRVMRVQRPPNDECVVLIGRFKRTKHPMHWLTLPMCFLWGAKNRGRLGEPTSDFNSATTTQVIGQLLIHVIHAPKLGRILKRFNFDAAVSGKLRLIWPVSATTEWPPEALTDHEADYVAGALYEALYASARRVLASRGNPERTP